jgi:hypothetical protein
MSKIGAYLATPYSHPDPAVQEWRFDRVNEAVALLIATGIDCLYSPISHTHPIDKHLTRQSGNHDFWVNKFDLPFLENSRQLLVLMLPGWSNSVGVKMEIQQARDRGIPVYYVTPRYNDMFHISGVETSIMPTA